MIMGLISLIACGTNKKSVSFTSLEGEWIIKEVNNKEIKAEEKVVAVCHFRVFVRQRYANFFIPSKKLLYFFCLGGKKVSPTMCRTPIGQCTGKG